MGLEPTTYGTTIRRSNQLSYIHHLAITSERPEGLSLPNCDAKLVSIFEPTKFFGKKN